MKMYFGSNVSDGRIQGSPLHVFFRDSAASAGVFQCVAAVLRWFKCFKKENRRSEGFLFLWWLPNDLLPLLQQEDRTVQAKLSNPTLTTWVWCSKLGSVWAQKRQLWHFSRSLHPGQNPGPRSSFPTTLGRIQIPWETLRTTSAEAKVILWISLKVPGRVEVILASSVKPSSKNSKNNIHHSSKWWLQNRCFNWSNDESESECLCYLNKILFSPSVTGHDLIWSRHIKNDA